MEIYVGSLPYTVTESDLKEAFTEFGEVASVRLVSDKFSGKSKGFGFVDMPDSYRHDMQKLGRHKRGRPYKQIKNLEMSLITEHQQA